MFRTTFQTLAAAALLFGAVSSANAVPMLRLQSSAGTDVTLADGAAGDLLSDPGAVLFVGPIAGWSLNVTSGFSKPVLGTTAAPELDLNSVNVSSGGTGWLKIWLTDTDFDAISGVSQALAAIGGTTSGSVTYQAFMDSSNTAFGTATELSNIDPFAPLAFSANQAVTMSSATPYSLTLLVSIFHERAGVTSFDATVKVPEPGTLLLFGIGLVVIAFVARRGWKAFGSTR